MVSGNLTTTFAPDGSPSADCNNPRFEIKISLPLGSSPPVTSPCPPVSHPYLDVPCTEKDEARVHGARSEAAISGWYVPDGKDSASFNARLP